MTLTQVSSRGVEDTLRWSLGASGTNHYTFTGPGLTGTVNDPTIYLTRGQTYIFENNSGGHPFYIKTSIANGGTNDAYNTGVTNNGGGNGTEIKFVVPHDSPDILYYQCSSHAAMAGQFSIAGSVADGSITRQKFATGAADVVQDTTPQLGGNLASNGNDIDLADNDKVTFGADEDLKIRHSSSDNNSYIEEAGGGSLVVKSDDFYVQNAGANHTQIYSDSDADVKLAHNGTFKLQTTQDGAKVLGTGNFVLPSGDTSQRGTGTAGSIRYNTQTSQLEIHNGTTWAGVGKSTPQITSVSNQNTAGVAGTSMVIRGEDFVSGATVHYVGTDGTNLAAQSVTFNSSTQLTITSPALTVANAPYAIKVTNPDGGLIIAAPEVEVTAGSAPNWTTATGQLGGGNLQKNAAVNITVAASDADGQAVTYSETTSVLTSNSNTPASTMNLSLNSSTGAITGTSPNVSADTTYNFTLRATDTATNFADRNFYIIVQAAPNPSYWFRGTSQGGNGLASGVTWSHTGYYPNATGGSNANADRLYNYGQGNSGTYAGFRQTGYTNGITIPVGHDRCDIYISQIARYNYSNGNQWTSTQPSGNSTGTGAFGNLMSNPSTGLHTYVIPAADQGQVRYFIMSGYAGQNGSWSQQVTLVKTYNQNNP